MLHRSSTSPSGRPLELCYSFTSLAQLTLNDFAPRGRLNYTQSLAIEAPYPETALRGTSSFTTNISPATHSLYSRPITSSSPIVCASVECSKGIGQAIFGSTTSLRVRVLVQAARPDVCYILLYACLSRCGHPKHTSYVPRHREEHLNVSMTAVGLCGKHVAGVGKVWVGTSQRPTLRFSPPAASQTGCFGRAAPQIARFEVPTGMITTPAKRSRHGVRETPLAADRPLRCGGCSDVYFDDE